MRQLLSLFVLLAFLLNNLSPAFAQSMREQARRRTATVRQRIDSAKNSRCNVSCMLEDPNHPNWLNFNESNVACFQKVREAFGKKSNKDKKYICNQTFSPLSTPWIDALNSLFLDSRDLWQDYYDIWHQIAMECKSLGLKRITVCIDSKTGKEVPCPKKQKDSTTSPNPNIPPNGEEIVTGDSTDYNFYFGQGERTDLELTEKIKRLTRMDKYELYNAIEVMVRQGSAISSDSHYVHSLILHAAFLLYAQKIKSEDQSKIEKYLNPKKVRTDIDPRYASRVREAAANALFAFAKENPGRVPEQQKFSLPSDKSVQRILSNAGVLTLSISDSFLFLESLAEAATAQGLDFGKFISAAKAAARTVKTGVSVVSYSGMYSFFVGGIAVFLYALEDAYSPAAKRAFARSKEEFWNNVFTPDVHSSREIYPLDDVDSVADVISFVTVWTPDMAKLGTDTKVETKTKTETKKRKKPTCIYNSASEPGADWQLNKLHEYVNNGDPLSVERAKFIHSCLERYSLCDEITDPSRLFSNCQEIKLKDMMGNYTCYSDIKQLIEVNKVASSFYAQGTQQKLFTRAIYKMNMEFFGGGKIGNVGRWIPEAEIGIRFEDPLDDVSSIFIQEVKDVVQNRLLSGIDEIFSLENFRRLRRGPHEKKTKYRWNPQEKLFDKKQTDNPYQHFHYEEFLTYPQKNPYICNHSIYYPVNP